MKAAMHFSIEEWADFARGLADRAKAMRDHLDLGCRECTEMHTRLAGVYEMARNDNGYEPPASAVQRARALFSSPRITGALERITESVKLLFDSDMAPAPVGIRNGVRQSPRRLVFAAGDIVVDIQVMPTSEPREQLLVGQITAPRRAAGRLPDMTVQLQDDTHIIGSAITNAFGEFQMNVEGTANDVMLAFESDQKPTIIPLGTFFRRNPS